MSQEVFCIHCGKPNPSGSQYCMYCGQLMPRLEPSGPEAPAPADGSLECPYCGQHILPAEGVTQLVCIQCAAAFVVRIVNGVKQLEILRFN